MSSVLKRLRIDITVASRPLTVAGGGFKRRLATKRVRVRRFPLSIYHDIMAEYNAAYSVVGWGKTPIHRMEEAQANTFNVYVKAEEGEEGAGMKKYNIDSHEYLRPTLPDTFGAEQLTPEKVAANTMFCQTLATVLKAHQKPQHVVVLDSPMGLTTAMVNALLLGSGVGVADAAKYLHVPNPAFESEPTPLCQKYRQTIFEWLRDMPPAILPTMVGKTHFWLDYCCTFKGCATQTLPQTDLKLLLHQRLLPERDGLLALTFSHRGVAGGSSATVQAVSNWLKTTAGPTFGYNFVLCNQMAYGKITLLLFKTAF